MMIPRSPFPASQILTDVKSLLALGHCGRIKTSATKTKLSTFEGVFLPQFLSTWGILTFLRLGFCIGQGGLLLSIAMIVLGFLIATSLSVSQAVLVSNDRNVLGGGVYFLLSRALGARKGTSMGIILLIGNILGGAMGVLGFTEFLIRNYGAEQGSSAKIFPESMGWSYLYGSMILALGLIIGLLGTKQFAKTSSFIFVIVILATISMNISLVARKSFVTTTVSFTGFNTNTLQGNLWPKWNEWDDQRKQLQEKPFELEHFSQLLGIIYPACTGMLAASSMTGDLKDAGAQIPKGSFLSIAITLLGYLVTLIFMAASVERESLVLNSNFVTEICLFPLLIKICMFAMSFYAILGTIVGCAKQLQAMARDGILPKRFAWLGHGYGTNDEATFAMLGTWILIQLCLFCQTLDLINPFITIFTLLTYCFVNFACLRMASTAGIPNYRPRFRISRKWQIFNAVMGLALMTLVMLVVNWFAAILLVTFTWVLKILSDKYAIVYSGIWGDLDAVRTEIKISSLLRKITNPVQQKQAGLSHAILSKYWRPSSLLLSRDLARATPIKDFFKMVFGPETLILHGAAMISTGLFKDSLFPYCRIVGNRKEDKVDDGAKGDDDDNLPELENYLKYHGLGQYTCNTVILSSDLTLAARCKLWQTSIGMGKNIIFPLNLECFDYSKACIDVWLIGAWEETSLEDLTRKKQHSLTITGTNLMTPGLSTRTSISDDGASSHALPLFSFPPMHEDDIEEGLPEPFHQQISNQRTIQSYGFLLQLAEMIRKRIGRMSIAKSMRGLTENIRVRLFLPIPAMEEPDSRVLTEQVSKMLHNLHFQYEPEIITVPMHPVTVPNVRDTQWIPCTLIQRWSGAEALLVLAPLHNRETFEDCWNDLCMPIILAHGSQPTLS